MGGSCGTSTSLALPQAAAAGSSAEQDLLLAVLSAQVLIHIFFGQFAAKHSLPLPHLGMKLFHTLLRGEATGKAQPEGSGAASPCPVRGCGAANPAWLHCAQQNLCLIGPTHTKLTCCGTACGGTCSCQQSRRCSYCMPKSPRSRMAMRKGRSPLPFPRADTQSSAL